ncbi:Uncharacterised protein [Actinomyces naeslundii]|nr:Uncharacterised protein [Actinomyces naeslundii]
MISCVLRELEKPIVYFSTIQMWCTSHVEAGLCCLTEDSRRTQIAGVLGLEGARDQGADEEAIRSDQEVRTAPRVSIPGLSTLQPWFSSANRVWSASVDSTSTVGPAPEMTAG